MLEKFKKREKLIDYLRGRDERGDVRGFNEDLASKILAKGGFEELKDLADFWRENGRQITDEEVEVFSYYQKLRQQVRQDCRAALEKRKINAPRETEEERILGCYLEAIEPQVRQVVLNLNRKGYKTQGSGFGPENTQKIYCADGQFAGLDFSTIFLSSLKERGVDLKIEPKSLTLYLSKRLSLDELCVIWQEIEKQIKLKDLT